LKEALQSILDTTIEGIEILVVNDGSTDFETIRILNEIASENIKVLHQENSGVAAARNLGIQNSTAPYFVPLDADNILFAPYLSDGLAWLETHPNCAVVYGDARIFGEKDGTWCNHPLKLNEIVFENYIDNCALIRKTAWEKVGGYDTKSPVATREDYIFWLDLLYHEFDFYHLKDFCFGYRYLENSKVRRLYKDQKKRLLIEEYIFLRQSRLIGKSVLSGQLDRKQQKRIMGKLLLKLAHNQLGFGSIVPGYNFLFKSLYFDFGFFRLIKVGFGWPIRRLLNKTTA
jgi:glycosyltransferase involved in cell wall biosynthesis